MRDDAAINSEEPRGLGWNCCDDDDDTVALEDGGGVHEDDGCLAATDSTRTTPGGAVSRSGAASFVPHAPMTAQSRLPLFRRSWGGYELARIARLPLTLCAHTRARLGCRSCAD